MTIELQPSAVEDVRGARDYDNGAQTGLGEEFLRELDRLFARLSEFPLSSQSVEGYDHVRRARVQRFPFAVFYRTDDSDGIHVLRVVHTARDPESWVHRDG